MEVMIDLKTAIIFLIIGFLAGAAFGAIRVARSMSQNRYR